MTIKRTQILIIAILTLVAGLVFIYSQQGREEEQNPVDGKALDAVQDGLTVNACESEDRIINSDHAFTFLPPEDYVFFENPAQDSQDQLYSASLFRTNDYEDFMDITDAREGPTGISIEIFSNEANLSLEDWVTTNSRSNYQFLITEPPYQSHAFFGPNSIGGHAAMRYSWDGLYTADSVVTIQNNRVYMLTVTYTDPKDPTRQIFDEMLTTFSFLVRSLDNTQEAVFLCWQNAHFDIFLTNRKEVARIASQVMPEGQGGLLLESLRWTPEANTIGYEEIGLTCLENRTCRDLGDFKNQLFSFRVNTRSKAKKEVLILETPEYREVVQSPLTIAGEARGYWHFEATFPVELQDAQGSMIAQHYAEAQDEWMTEGLVPFKAVLEFNAPENVSTGKLILHKHNASGMPEHDDFVEMPVKFSKKALVGGEQTGVFIMNQYPNKIVYTIDAVLNFEPYQKDCKDQGGQLNTCGSMCGPEVEACATVCALVCEF